MRRAPKNISAHPRYHSNCGKTAAPDPINPYAFTQQSRRGSTCRTTAFFLPTQRLQTRKTFRWLAPTAISLQVRFSEYSSSTSLSEYRYFSTTLVICQGFYRNYFEKILPIQEHYSLFLCILPLMVLGSSVRNSTILGYLYGAVCFLT